MKAVTLVALSVATAVLAPAARAGEPKYKIIDLGVIGTDTGSQAMGISPNGNIVVGRSLGSDSQAYSWTPKGGMVALPNLAKRNFAIANGANNSGTVVGTSVLDWRGDSPVPVIWNHGTVSQLQMPFGYTVGEAFGVNAAGVVAGAVGSGPTQRAALFTGGKGSVITATTSDGSFMNVAFGINKTGLVIGSGVDPHNAAVNVGLVYNSITGKMTNLGALNGADGALAFGVSNDGYVVGSSMFEQGPGLPFIWSSSHGIVPISLPAGTFQGSAHGVNDEGWAVGVASGNYAVPFLYAGGSTYTVQSLLPAGSGWDLSTNTSSSALAITDAGTIIGTGVHNGLTHGYEMELIPSVPEPATSAMLFAGLGVIGLGAARRQRQGA